MNSLFSGAAYLVEGIKLIFKPGLRRFVFVPFISSIVLLIISLGLLSHYINIFNSWFENYLPTWLQWLGIMVWMLFFLNIILLFLYIFTVIATTLGAPFNSLLAEKVELLLTGNQTTPFRLIDSLKDAPRILFRQMTILGYYAIMAILVFVCLFIPIIQTFVMLIWFLCNAWFIALLYVDFPTDNHRIPLREVRKKLRQHVWSTFGFGISVLLLMAIPLLNFITIPAAVAGATKFWFEELRH